jgi:hypothetical protein
MAGQVASSRSKRRRTAIAWIAVVGLLVVVAFIARNYLSGGPSARFSAEDLRRQVLFFNDDHGLVRATVDGQDPELIRRFNIDEVYLNIGAKVSPDGRHLAMLMTDQGPDVAGIRHLLTVTDLRGGHARVLATAQFDQRPNTGTLIGDFAWSPDSSAIMYVAQDKPRGDVNSVSELRIARIQQQPPKPSPVPGSKGFHEVNFHPNGRSVVGTIEEQSHELVQLDLETGRRTVLATGPRNKSGAGWSPDGRRLAWAEGRHDGEAVVIRDLQTGHTDEVFDADWCIQGVSFGPDGRIWLAREGCIREPGYESPDLYVITPRKPYELQQVTDTSQSEYAPSVAYRADQQ